MSPRLVRLLASWIALVAIALVTFMPTISMATSTGVGFDVCSASEPRSPSPAGGHHVLDHCPYCALHADLAPPPQPAVAVALRGAAWRDLPVAFLRAPRASGVWVTSQPRAPPQGL